MKLKGVKGGCMQEYIEKLQNVNGSLDVKVKDMKIFVNEVYPYPMRVCIWEEEEKKSTK